MDVIDPLLPGGFVTIGEVVSSRAKPYLVGLKTDGKAYLFDNNDTNYPLGFVDASGGALAIDDAVQLQSSGRIAGFTGLTIGTPYYADPSSPGEITVTKPISTSYPQVIGVAHLATGLEMIAGHREDPTVVHSGNNQFLKAGVASITGSGEVTTSGFSSITAVMVTLDGGSGPYSATGNEMGVRTYVTGANTFKIYVDKLSGVSVGNWVIGTTARNVQWIAVGVPA